MSKEESIEKGTKTCFYRTIMGTVLASVSHETFLNTLGIKVRSISTELGGWYNFVQIINNQQQFGNKGQIRNIQGIWSYDYDDNNIGSIVHYYAVREETDSNGKHIKYTVGNRYPDRSPSYYNFQLKEEYSVGLNAQVNGSHSICQTYALMYFLRKENKLKTPPPLTNENVKKIVDIYSKNISIGLKFLQKLVENNTHSNLEWELNSPSTLFDFQQSVDELDDYCKKYIKDLSTLGTFLNGNYIIKQLRKILHNKKVITLLDLLKIINSRGYSINLTDWKNIRGMETTVQMQLAQTRDISRQESTRGRRIRRGRGSRRGSTRGRGSRRRSSLSFRRKSVKKSRRRKSVKKSIRRKSVKKSIRRKSVKGSRRRKSVKKSIRRKSVKGSRRRKSVKGSRRRKSVKRSRRRKSGGRRNIKFSMGRNRHTDFINKINNSNEYDDQTKQEILESWNEYANRHENPLDNPLLGDQSSFNRWLRSFQRRGGAPRRGAAPRRDDSDMELD